MAARLGGSTLVLLLLLALLSLTHVSAQYVIVELDSVSVGGAGVPSLASRTVGVASSGFGSEWSSEATEVDLLALPLENEAACQPTTLPQRSTSSPPLVLLVRRGNCTFAEKARQVQQATVAVGDDSAVGAYGLLVVNDADSSLFAMPPSNATSDASLTVRAAMIEFEVGSQLIAASLAAVDGGGSAAAPRVLAGARIYSYERAAFDASFLLMFALAVGTIVFGAYLAAADERRAARARASGSQLAPRSAAIAGEESAPPQYLTVWHAAGFIVMASISLVTIYFFIRWAIYVLLVLFCLGSLTAVTSLLTAFMRWAHPSYTNTIRVPCAGVVSVYTALSFAIALVLTTTWVCTRNAAGAWLLQDLLGVSLLLTLQQSLRLPDLKVPIVLLSQAFFYDIFWVFLSPYFFEQSVMVAVASGGGTGEAVPMMLRIPRMQDTLGGYSGLGLGDIALPGLLISYLIRFDYTNGAERSWLKSYFGISTLGYAVGLVATYVALAVSGQGQPALLYLVPCTLGVVLFVSYSRGDLREMLSGQSGERGGGTSGNTSEWQRVDTAEQHEPINSTDPAHESINSPTVPSAADADEQEMMDQL